MTKYKLFIDETRSFRHVIEVETELNEDQLDKFITENIDNDKTIVSLDDMTEKLKDNGLKVTKARLDDNGCLGEIEITDIEEIEEPEQI